MSITDTYVKVQVLSPRGKDVAKSKTTLRKGMNDPEYNESFVFQMAEPDLSEITIMFSVISLSKTRKKKDVMGWFALGKNPSGEIEKKHWKEVVENKESSRCHWHTLSGIV